MYETKVTLDTIRLGRNELKVPLSDGLPTFANRKTNYLIS